MTADKLHLYLDQEDKNQGFFFFLLLFCLQHVTIYLRTATYTLQINTAVASLLTT